MSCPLLSSGIVERAKYASARENRHQMIRGEWKKCDDKLGNVLSIVIRNKKTQSFDCYKYLAP